MTDENCPARVVPAWTIVSVAPADGVAAVVIESWPPSDTAPVEVSTSPTWPPLTAMPSVPAGVWVKPAPTWRLAFEPTSTTPVFTRSQSAPATFSPPATFSVPVLSTVTSFVLNRLTSLVTEMVPLLTKVPAAPVSPAP